MIACDKNKIIGVGEISLSDIRGSTAQKHIGGFGISIAKEYRGEGIEVFSLDI